jgi:hypothetical protein
MHRIAAELVNILPDLRPGHDLAPLSMAPVVRYRLVGGTVSVLDDRLQPVRSLSLDVPPAAKLLAAAPDLACVVLADEGSVTVLAARERISVDVAAADSGTLLPGGRLLVTAPASEQRTSTGRAGGRPAGSPAATSGSTSTGSTWTDAF